MTEAQWNSCGDPVVMLKSLLASGKASDRRWRLFACACCRRIWDRFPDPRNRDLVAAVEEHPDASFEDPALEAAIAASSARESEFSDRPAYWVAKHLGRGFYKLTAAVSAYSVACQVLTIAADGHAREFEGGIGSALVGVRLPGGALAEAWILAGLVRDIFGWAPSQLMTVPRDVLAWNDGLVVRLAQAIYDGCRWGDMPILADALLDAGCDNDDVLAHCRQQEGVHARGCWVVDLLLNKE